MSGPGSLRRRYGARCRRLFVERLEDRSLLAAVITVNSTVDLDARDQSLTLREAILINNRTLPIQSLSPSERAQVTGVPSDTDTDTIAFNIPSASGVPGEVHTIRPDSALPSITDAVIIDGYTQPLAKPNTNPVGQGLDTVLLVELEGLKSGSSGLILQARSTVRGLAIYNFFGGAVFLQPGSDGSAIEGNFLGFDASSKAIGQFTGADVRSARNTIGGTTPAARNLIFADITGILLVEAQTTGNLIQGNLIGTAADGITPPGVRTGTGTGIYIDEAAGNTIGGTAPGAANTIAFTSNAFGGVQLVGKAFSNPILGNSIFGNAGLGIDLSANGLTPNDAGDADNGPDNLQNFPEISAATLTGSELAITYKVPSDPANSNYPLRVEFFRADADGQEGQTFIGFDTFMANDFAAGSKTARFATASVIAPGTRIVATASDGSGNTSEFSANATATLPVNSGTLDFGDAPSSYGTLLAGNGARHLLGVGPLLGRAIDADADGQPNAAASGDDAAGVDDEDGVTLPASLIAGLNAAATVTASAPGRLDAWVDFNRNGTFEPGEQIAARLAVNGGANTVTFAVPLSAAGGTTYARFRLSSAGGLGPTGEAADGEIEDYAIRVIRLAPDTAVLINDPANPGKKVLVVVGTAKKDDIRIQRGPGGTILCRRGCRLSVFPASEVDRIVVLADSNDTVRIEPTIKVPVQVQRRRRP